MLMTQKRRVAIFSFFVLISSAAVSANKPDINPYLSSPLYGITHFDSAQSDSTPYGPPPGEFIVNPVEQPISYGGPVSIITLASKDKDYMWGVSNNRVSYLSKADGVWKDVAAYEPLTHKFGDPDLEINSKLKDLGTESAKGYTLSEMDDFLKSKLPGDYNSFGNGGYSVVDDQNVLYTKYANSLFAFELNDPADPSLGFRVKHKIDDIVEAFQGEKRKLHVFGLAMTYDGFLLVTFRNGVGVIDRNFSPASKHFYRFKKADEFEGNEDLKDDAASNSVAVDKNNGIYVATNKYMRKLVWVNSNGRMEISDKEEDGAWLTEYNIDKEVPPIVKLDNGTGATPTLMGFGDDPDKLVVITDGQKQMNLVAFWRDEIPADFKQREGTKSRRIAGQIGVTCGLDQEPNHSLPEWIQTEQSVVVSGYGAFVVNNIPKEVAPELRAKNGHFVLQVSLMGPVYSGPLGVERFEWDTKNQEWKTVWNRPDIASNSMVPVHSQSSSMALVNGYYADTGWEVTGLDWDCFPIGCAINFRFSTENYS